jgi:hypothetical protein
LDANVGSPSTAHQMTGARNSRPGDDQEMIKRKRDVRDLTRELRVLH